MCFDPPHVDKPSNEFHEFFNCREAIKHPSSTPLAAGERMLCQGTLLAVRSHRNQQHFDAALSRRSINLINYQLDALKFPLAGAFLREVLYTCLITFDLMCECDNCAPCNY